MLDKFIHLHYEHPQKIFSEFLTTPNWLSFISAKLWSLFRQEWFMNTDHAERFSKEYFQVQMEHQLVIYSTNFWTLQGSTAT